MVPMISKVLTKMKVLRGFVQISTKNHANQAVYLTYFLLTMF